MEKPEEKQESIDDVRKQLSSISDDDLQQVHDDIAEDSMRFIEHVGIEKGSAFLAVMLAEMHGRKMEVNAQFPQNVETSWSSEATIHAELTHEPKPIGNRAQRRRMKSKAKGSPKIAGRMVKK